MLSKGGAPGITTVTCLISGGGASTFAYVFTICLGCSLTLNWN